jgi:hypothetical protein
VTLSECARDPRVRGSVDLIAIARGRSATRRSQSGGPAEARAARAPNERAPAEDGQMCAAGRGARTLAPGGSARAGQRRADHVTSAGACGVAAQGALMLSIGRDGARPTGHAWERPDEQAETGAQRQRRQMVEEPCRPKAELGHGRTNGRNVYRGGGSADGWRRLTCGPDRTGPKTAREVAERAPEKIDDVKGRLRPPRPSPSRVWPAPTVRALSSPIRQPGARWRTTCRSCSCP